MASLGLGAFKFSLPRTREEMVYFSSLPKSKDFPFSVCEMQEGNLGKGCGQASAHTPDIPLPPQSSPPSGRKQIQKNG